MSQSVTPHRLFWSWTGRLGATGLAGLVLALAVTLGGAEVAAEGAAERYRADAQGGWLANLEFAAQPSTERASEDPLLGLSGGLPSQLPSYRHGPNASLRGEVTGIDLHLGGGVTLPQRLSFGRTSEVWARAGYFRAGDPESAPDADGQRLRLEYRSHEPFGLAGGTLSLAGELHQDGRGDTHSVGMLRLQVPLARIADLALGRAARTSRPGERLALGSTALAGTPEAGADIVPGLSGFSLGGGLNLLNLPEEDPVATPGRDTEASNAWSAAVQVDVPTLLGLKP